MKKNALAFLNNFPCPALQHSRPLESLVPNKKRHVYFFSNQTLGKRLFAKSINMRLPWHPQKMIKLQKRKKKIPKGLSCQVSHKESLFYSYVYVVLGVCTEKKNTLGFSQRLIVYLFLKVPFKFWAWKKTSKSSAGLQWIFESIFFFNFFQSKDGTHCTHTACTITSVQFIRSKFNFKYVLINVLLTFL